MEINAICEYLEWDSDFFGNRIARTTANYLNAETVAQALSWCEANQIDCLYFLANADDSKSIRLAEDQKFHFMDLRVTLENSLDSRLKPQDLAQEVIRLFQPDDISALRAIARRSYHDTRFYQDPNFSEELCNRLYETWIEKSCHGYADAVLVAEFAGGIAGYISCHLLDPSMGSIGLVGVSPKVQRQGFGKKLVKASLNWFAEKGVKRVQVVTQGRNAKAQRLYQRNGFLTTSLQLWYHRWFPSGRSGTRDL